jgi:hypothetical protein
MHGQELASVEPVCGHLRTQKRGARFTLRGKRKVNSQWRLSRLVHPIEKLLHYGRMVVQLAERGKLV